MHKGQRIRNLIQTVQLSFESLKCQVVVIYRGWEMQTLSPKMKIVYIPGTNNFICGFQEICKCLKIKKNVK